MYDHPSEATPRMFFDAPDYEDIRLCEGPRVREYWESGLAIQTLNDLRQGNGRHTHSVCYHCNSRGHLKANCPDRKRADKTPWERTWRAKKWKWHQKAGGGNTERPLQSRGTETETLENIVDLTENGCEEVVPNNWDLFMNTLKIVKVDKTQGIGQGRKDHTRMYVPTLVTTTLGSGGKASVTMALPDSGNLLAHAAIDEKFHEQLGVPILATNIKARAANKQSLEIWGGV